MLFNFRHSEVFCFKKMKNKFSHILLFVFAFGLFSCNPREIYHYQYEANPVFSWGYAEYWGAYYQKYGNNNSVLSLSLFSDSLSVDSTGNLQGFGQYMYLEDVFLSQDKIFLPDGNYEVSLSADSMSIAPGRILKIDGVEYNVGAVIYYLEKDASLSTSKMVTGGSMDITLQDSTTTANCHFELEDGTALEGTFKALLPYYDQSWINLQNNGFFTRSQRVRQQPL